MIDLSLATFGNVRDCSSGRLREINLTAKNLKEINNHCKIIFLETLLSCLYVSLIKDCSYNKLSHEKVSCIILMYY